jgi:hypothetical protein
MKARRYRIRTGARAASKVQEKELIKKAKRLSRNPELIIPQCGGECRRCIFDKTRAQLRRVQQAMEAGNERLLSGYAKHGDALARAYAATLSIALAGKAPYLAVFRTPFGEVPYAYRGKAKREKLIGVQYFDDPKLRLLSVVDLVHKRGLHIYSAKDTMTCTGREPKPPSQFVQQMLQGLKYPFPALSTSAKVRGNLYTCPI